MRNAGASIDPPPDPYAAVPPERPVALPADRRDPADRDAAPPRRKKLPPGVSPLPPGVSPEGFTSPSGRPATLPPPAPPAQPWPVTGSARVRWGQDDPSGRPSIIMVPEPPESRGRLRRLLLIGCGVAVLFLLGYGIPATYMWGKVLPRTRIGDVRIGGLTETEAIDRIHARFDGNDQESIGLILEGRRVAVLDPRAAGLTIDVQTTVAGAQTGFPSPLAVWRSFTGERNLPIKVSTNHVKLAQRVRKLARTIDRPPRQGRIGYVGLTPRIVMPRDGVVLDQQATTEAIKRAFVEAPASVALPVSAVPSNAAPAAFTGLLDDARRAVAGPVTLTNGGRKVRLSPAVIAANLTFTADASGAVGPRFHARKALGGLEAGLVGAAEAPKSAGFVIENGAPRLVRARMGKGVDDAALTAALSRMIEQDGGRTIPVSLAVTRPALTDKEAAELGVREKVSEFTTDFACCAARVTNIRRAAGLVNGHMVKPGETFSLNEVIGRPQASRGFVAAQAIEDDHLVIAMGGGVSQVATTMFNAAYLAGMEDIDHTEHSFHVMHYPAGRDAAVGYPEPDLRWRNDSRYGVLITTSTTATSVTVTLWSTKIYDRIEAETSERTDVTQPVSRTDADRDCIPMDGGPGFTVTVTRVFHKDGKVVKRERPQTTVYEPRRKVICGERRPPASGGTVDPGHPHHNGIVQSMPTTSPSGPDDGRGTTVKGPAMRENATAHDEEPDKSPRPPVTRRAR